MQKKRLVKLIQEATTAMPSPEWEELVAGKKSLNKTFFQSREEAVKNCKN